MERRTKREADHGAHQHDASRSAVLTAPDSDEPRIAFAERLESQGDPRGAFVRLQVEHARATDDAERRRLALQLSALRLDPAWEEPIRQVGLKHPKYRPAWAFRRGLIEHVTTTADWLLAHGDALFDAEPVRSVTLTRVPDDALAQLARQPWLGRLRHLGLTVKPTAPVGDLLGSAHLGELRSLDLNWMAADPSQFPKDLGPRPVQALIDSGLCSRLRSLRAAIGTAKAVVSLLPALESIERLGLARQGGFSQRDAEKIGAAMSLPALRALRVPNAIKPAHAPALTELAVLHSSRELDPDLLRGLVELRVWGAFAADVEQIARAEAPALRRLTVYQARADGGDEVVRSLAAAELPALDELEVAGAPASDAAVGDLVDSGRLQALRALSLWVTKGQDAAPVLDDLHGIEELRLHFGRGAPVGALGSARCLAQLSLFGGSADPIDPIIEQLLGSDLPALRHLSVAHPLGADAAGALLSRAPKDLCCLWVRLDGVSKTQRGALEDRFVVYERTVKHGDALSAMKDWRWAWHPWGPDLAWAECEGSAHPT